MRSILLLVLGLVVGALAAAKVTSVMQMRDAYPRGVMSVMQHHLGTLAMSVRQGQCPAQATQMHLAGLKAMQPDVLQAFSGSLSGKADFRKHAQQLEASVNDAIAAAPAACPALQKAVSQIGGACKSCHEAYR